MAASPEGTTTADAAAATGDEDGAEGDVVAEADGANEEDVMGVWA